MQVSILMIRKITIICVEKTHFEQIDKFKINKRLLNVRISKTFTFDV